MTARDRPPSFCLACKGAGYVGAVEENEDRTAQRTARLACYSCHGTGYELSREAAADPVVRVIGDVAWRLRAAGIGDNFGAWERVEVSPAIELNMRRRKGAKRR